MFMKAGNQNLAVSGPTRAAPTARLNHSTRPPMQEEMDTYLMLNSCSVHYWCYMGLDARGSKAPLAAAVLAVPGSAARRVIDAAAPEG
jgi:hypothetical protein